MHQCPPPPAPWTWAGVPVAVLVVCTVCIWQYKSKAPLADLLSGKKQNESVYHLKVFDLIWNELVKGVMLKQLNFSCKYQT
jgi:hypothetical protein